LAKGKTNKKKQNSRANRKVETAKRLETEKKAQAKVTTKVSPKPDKEATSKQSEIKTVKAKVSKEPSKTASKTKNSQKVTKETTQKKGSTNTNAKKKESSKKEVTKKETLVEKLEEKATPQKVSSKPLEPAPEIGSLAVFSPRKLTAIAAILVAFALLYNICVVSIGNVAVAKPTETTKKPIVTELSLETTTEEEETYPVTQAPEVEYNKSAGSDAPVEAPKDITLSVPFVNQCPDYPTGCEAASACMLLRYWGYNVSLDAMIAAIPRQNIYEKNGKAYGPSIYEKFVGDPRCTYTDSTPGYGAFSPVVTSSIWRFTGPSHEVKNITGSTLDTLFSYLDQGCPVIVWATYAMRQPTRSNIWYIEGSYEEEPFQYPRGTHVFVLCGYNSSVVRLMDPYGAGLVAYSQSAFSSKYNLLGRQAIVIVPKETTTEETTTEVPKTSEKSAKKDKQTEDPSKEPTKETTTAEESTTSETESTSEEESSTDTSTTTKEDKDNKETT